MARYYSVWDVNSLRDFEKPARTSVVLLLVDAGTIDLADVVSFAAKAIARGARWFCAWGPGCESVHDAIDEAAIPFEGADEDSVIPTTWHDDESLRETVAFWRTCTTLPGDAARCSHWEAIAVGHPDWSAEVRSLLNRKSRHAWDGPEGEGAPRDHDGRPQSGRSADREASPGPARNVTGRRIVD